MSAKFKVQPGFGQRVAAWGVAVVLLFLPVSPLLAYFNGSSCDRMPCCHGKSAARCPMHQSRGAPSFESLPGCCGQCGQAPGISGWAEVFLPPPEIAPARLSQPGKLIQPAFTRRTNQPACSHLYQRPPPFDSDPA